MKTVIEMAHETLERMKADEHCREQYWSATDDELQAFAELVRADEREACAKVCDDISEDQWALYKGRPPYTGQELERASEYTQGKSDGAEVCAAAIRARSNT